MTDPVIHGLSNEQYHHGEEERQYLSSSLLKKYLISPKAYKFALDNPTEEKSDALRFGSLFHDCMAALAEGATLCEVIDAIAAFEPPINEKTGQPYGSTTKAYAAAYEKFTAELNGVLASTAEEKELVSAMLNSLLYSSGATSEQVRKLLKWAKATEVSYFYETEDGIKLKVRPDLLTNGKIVDWKTCSRDSLDEENIARQIIKYRYDVSLSMYQWVLHKIEGKWYTPILIFIQKSAPFDSIMCDISEWCYMYDKTYDVVTTGCGALEFRRLLDLHTECVKNNEWPGAENALEADGNVRIMKPKIPAYFGMKYYNE